MLFEEYKPIMDRYVAFLRQHCEIFENPLALAMSAFDAGKNDKEMMRWANAMTSGEMCHNSDADCIAIEELSVSYKGYKTMIGEMAINLEVLLQESGSFGHVIDIGCGQGIVDTFMLKEGLAKGVVGIDPSLKALGLAKELAIKVGVPSETKYGWIQEIPADDDSADTCLALGVLEWSKEWRKGLAEMARVVRPGGLLYAAASGQQFRTIIDSSEAEKILIKHGIKPRISLIQTNLFPKIFIFGHKN